MNGFEQSLKTKKLGNNLTDIQIGSFVFYKESKNLFFRDSSGKQHSPQKISLVSSGWNTEDQNKNFPKPNVIDKNGTLIQIGEQLLYSFIDSATDNIVVLGSLVNINLKSLNKATSFDIQDLNNLSEKNLIRNNAQRYFTFREDAKGDVIFYLEGKEDIESDESENGTGNVTIKVNGFRDNKSQNGNFKFETNGIICINQVQKEGEKEKIISQLLIDNTKDQEVIQLIDQFKNLISMTKDGISIQNTNENKILLTKDGIDIVSKGDAKVEAKNVTITGGKLKVSGSCKPNGQGAFLAVPNGQCVFSGALIAGSEISGT